MLDHFWARWRKEYVTYLRESQRYSFNPRSTTVSLDDIVIVFDEKEPRNFWRIGRVVKLIPSEIDDEIRGVEIMGKANAIIRRPVIPLDFKFEKSYRYYAVQR